MRPEDLETLRARVVGGDYAVDPRAVAAAMLERPPWQLLAPLPEPPPPVPPAAGDA